MSRRTAELERTTSETRVEVRLDLDGSGKARLDTGIPFLDHMLDALARHGSLDLTVKAKGDLEVDDHHTVEYVPLVLGQAVDQALGERRGLKRFGSAYAPLDEALARCVIDFSSRPFAYFAGEFRRERIGGLSTENVSHFFASFASTSRCTLHLDLLRSENDHHAIEALFKAFALTLREACTRTGDLAVPSTKGVLA